MQPIQIIHQFSVTEEEPETIVLCTYFGWHHPYVSCRVVLKLSMASLGDSGWHLGIARLSWDSLRMYWVVNTSVGLQPERSQNLRCRCIAKKRIKISEISCRDQCCYVYWDINMHFCCQAGHFIPEVCKDTLNESAEAPEPLHSLSFWNTPCPNHTFVEIMELLLRKLKQNLCCCGWDGCCHSDNLTLCGSDGSLETRYRFI